MYQFHCEGWNYRGRWINCDREEYHFHNDLNMERSNLIPFTRLTIEEQDDLVADFIARMTGHDEACAYTLKATTLEMIEHFILVGRGSTKCPESLRS